MSRTQIYALVAVAFAIFAAAMLALVLYGQATHTEPTFMRVCWTGDKVTYIEGASEEENRGPCAEPEELSWPQSQLPITVTPVPPEGERWTEAMDDAVEAAVNDINRQLGYPHFGLVAFPPGDPLDRPESDVLVVYGAPYETGEGTVGADRAAATCEITRKRDGADGGGDARLVGTIQLRDISDIHLTHRILLHELGHCGLGLAHDNFTDSPMYNWQDPEAEGWTGVRFSDTDREALRKKYGR
jgi:hypothetical protein